MSSQSGSRVKRAGSKRRDSRRDYMSGWVDPVRDDFKRHSLNKPFFASVSKAKGMM